MTILESDCGYLACLVDEIVKKNKARFRYTKSIYADYWYWAPLNYAAETFHLMRVYGHTNIARRFKP